MPGDELFWPKLPKLPKQPKLRRTGRLWFPVGKVVLFANSDKHASLVSRGSNDLHQSFIIHAQGYLHQGSLTEGEGSVQLTSLYLLVLIGSF